MSIQIKCYLWYGLLPWRCDLTQNGFGGAYFVKSLRMPPIGRCHHLKNTFNSLCLWVSFLLINKCWRYWAMGWYFFLHLSDTGIFPRAEDKEIGVRSVVQWCAFQCRIDAWGILINHTCLTSYNVEVSLW